MANSKFWNRNTSKKAQLEIARTAAAIGVDPRAVNILFNTHWDEDDKLMGWVSRPATPAEDLKFAQQAGVMLDSEEMDHDERIAWVIAARDKVKPRAVADAFLESLSSRNPAGRSALGSYAHALHLKPHAFEKGEDGCAVCGTPRKARKVDRSSRNFRRLKWAGNVEQGDMEYVGCDLELFAKLRPVKPTEEQTDVLRAVLSAIRRLPATARLSDLNKALTGLFPSDKQERQVVLEILGYAGVLRPKAWPSYFEGWPRADELPSTSSEWSFPTCGWKGKDGVNEKAVKFWFPKL